MALAPSTLTLPTPDDWHVHVRSGALLRAVLPATARHFGRAIVMPNLKPPVVTTAQGVAYREEIRAALPEGSAFTPLMTAYLTDATDPEDLLRGHREGVFTAAKLYPANATTNSEFGVTNIRAIHKVLAAMEKGGMPLLVHGEVTDPEVDIFDREAVFIEKAMIPLRGDFPGLKVVFEHVTTRQAVDYVRAEGQKGLLGATITAHHLRINRNAIFTGGVRPHYYCLPVAKREEHRKALVQAATSGDPMFFLGTDTAPHPRSAKECACGCAGIFTAVNALSIYAHVFDEEGALGRFESFASRNGPAFYGLPVNKTLLTLEKGAEPNPPLKSILTAEGAEIVCFQDDAPLFWRVREADTRECLHERAAC